MWLLLLACSIGAPGPAAPGSRSAAAAQETRAIADEAAEISRLAAELTSLVDESRRGVEEGRLDKDTQIQAMRALMDQIDTRNTALRERAEALDTDLRGSQEPGSAL